uniref:Breast cancer anti-estrogen resistance protein 1 n=1 Tax=Aotus nancymaae TaxID=37293 RepID=A0A2K5E483_AOTNA
QHCPLDTMNHLNVLAKTLYDNVAESPDELSFRKGDIMTVLEQDTQGLESWWLCSLHGRQGIVPGNCLKILAVMYNKKSAGSGPGPPAGLHGPVPPTSQYTPTLPATYQPLPNSVYLVPTPSNTRQGLYQDPGPSPQFQSSPAKQTSTFSKQTPHHPFSQPGHLSGATFYWDGGTKPPAKWWCPPMWGRAMASRDTCWPPAPQDIYDVLPVWGLLPSQYGQEGSNGQAPLLEVYEVLPSVKGLPLSSHHAVYNFPPSVSKDMPDGLLLREETYEVPPHLHQDSPPAEDVYDVPPPAPDLYDVPPGLRRPGPGTHTVADGGEADDGVYALPPPAEREAPAAGKRLTRSTRSSQSASSLEVVGPGREPLELEVAVEALARLQQGVSATVAHLLDLAGSAGGTRSWRSTPEPQEPLVQELRGAVHELLEFAHSAVGNAAHTSDRALHAKLNRQLQKMEDVHQMLVAHGPALDAGRGGPGATPEDLDRLVACSRAVPEDAKQLASFLHGNASLLFRRTKTPAPGPKEGGTLHPNLTDKVSSIQSRPLPSPAKFTSQDSPDGQYENSEGGWVEDYDYVHLQGKEEFEKTQKELLEKGSRARQFQRLEQPIDHDLANWTPAQPLAPGQTGSPGPSDQQLLLFYLEHREANLTTLINAVDAFFTAVATNQPHKIFVAHSTFVILSAHKLVFIRDTLSQQAKAADVRSQVTHYSNLLCNLLRGIVATTKASALQYPSPSAAQDMVERVNELGHSARQFRSVLGQLAAPRAVTPGGRQGRGVVAPAPHPPSQE